MNPIADIPVENNMDDIKHIDDKLAELCHDHRIDIDKSYGSLYLTIRYWFHLGYEIGKDKGYNNGYHDGRYPIYDPDPFTD